VSVAAQNPLRRAALMMRLAPFADLAVTEVDDLAAMGEARIDAVLIDATSWPRCAAPVVALVGDTNQAAQALAGGARGVLLRNASPRRIHATLRAVTEGATVIDDEVADHLVRVRPRVDLIEPLTPREQEVLALLADGLTNKEIAQRLAVTDHTVKFHINGILRKLGVSTRTEAVVQAARLALLVV
jgi:two-component system nitrate/nitrite response regulator NarL